MAVFYFSGYENYLKKQEIGKIVKTIDCPELNVGKFHEWGEDVESFIESYPFVGDKKLCILSFFPDKEECLSSLRGISDCVDVYIVTSDVPDRRKKAVKEILSLAKEKRFEKISDELLFKCISSMLTRLGYEPALVSSMKEHLMEAFKGYRMHAEMDLEEVQKHVKLMAFAGTLTPETIRAFAPDGAEYRSFKLSSMLLAKDGECLAFARKLLENGESAIGLFSLVAYQIRVCYKAVLFGGENHLKLIGIRDYQLYERFADYSADKYIKVYALLMDGINRVKKGGNSEAVMADTLMAALAELKGGI